MKKISLKFAALIIILATSCEKEEIKPSTPNPRSKVLDCRKCEGQWDLTDTIPK